MGERQLPMKSEATASLVFAAKQKAHLVAVGVCVAVLIKLCLHLERALVRANRIL